MKKIFLAITMALFGTAVFADNVLILGGEGDSYVSVQTELEAAGHTVTYDGGTVLPGDISGYQQIWDMRYNTALSDTDMAAYDTFLQNNGYLYLSGEHGGFATRNNSISAFTNTLGGGTITVDGYASNDQEAVEGFFGADTEVHYFMAAIITIDEGGTARVMSTDANGNPTGIMYIGNAGDLGEAYNGTVVVVADINWTQSMAFDGSYPQNEQFLYELINGIAAGTVGGTISESGNGDAGNIVTEPVEPEVTVTGTEAGDPIVVITSADGGTVTTITTAHGVSETETEQTVETIVTTVLTAATETTTCTTPTTITNYSDGSSTVANGTETCTTETTYEVTSSAETSSVSGRIDQAATVRDVTSTNLRGMTFDSFKAVRSMHTYDNGMEGETTGFTLGGSLSTDNGMSISGGFGRINTDLSGNGDTATAATNVIEGSVSGDVGMGKASATVRYGMTDYNLSRTIGDWKNSGSTSGTNVSLGGKYLLTQDPNFKPYIGYTIGRETVDAYTEGGSILTARSVKEVSEIYRYGTVGAEMKIGLLNLQGEYNTDGVQTLGVAVGQTKEKFDWKLGVKRTSTELGQSDQIYTGLQIKF